MNFLPNTGAHLGNIHVQVAKAGMAFIEVPLDDRCHFATGDVKGEEVMTIIIAGIIHLGPVCVETQIIAFGPL
jgi:hypothetical protein